MIDVTEDGPRLAPRQFLTFRLGERIYALPAEEVAEVIRPLPVARLPHGPAGLLGIANLRGMLLPVASLGGLIGCAAEPMRAGGRAIVLAGEAPVALAVDAVEALASVAADQIETRQSELMADQGERLLGAFPPGAAQKPVRILDIRALLAAAFVPRQARTARVQRQGIAGQGIAGRGTAGRGTAGPGITAQGSAEDVRIMLVTFEVAGQEFALPFAAVQEIMRPPSNPARMPRSEALVLGIADYRDGLLPLFSLRDLLGLSASAGGNAQPKVVVTRVAGVLVGLLADRMRAIMAADPALIDPIPPVLAARTGGETRIDSIYRGDQGRRLISILAPEQLFREDVMQRLGTAEVVAETRSGSDVRSEELKFLVFRLGADEFALPIETVDEVATVPTQISRMPRAPKFLDGVINLRGEVIPVIDQRRRFDMPALQDCTGQRLIVVRTARHKAAVIVDGVSEVLSCPADRIEPAPDLAGETTRLVSGLINLPTSGRIILLLDTSELLTPAEISLIAAFEMRASRAQASQSDP